MITVHVYYARLYDHVQEKKFKNKHEALAVSFARQQFEKPGVYKVKVWSGVPIPNRVDPPGLILELI